jgi:hypothetical protein
MIEFKVKAPADIRQLMPWWFVTIEPPYWYLRCRSCDLRRHLPWDARWRTPEAHEFLLQHGKRCAVEVAFNADKEGAA